MNCPETGKEVPPDAYCFWCGDPWDERAGDLWVFVNGKRWYHKRCIDLIDALA